MKQQGRVIRTQGREADVCITQLSACAKCGKCNLSHESRDLVISAVNVAQAQPGDFVILEMAHTSVFLAALIAYGLPLLVMFLGAFLGQAIGGELLSAVLGFSGLGLGYILIRWVVDPRLKAQQNYEIKITTIIDPREVNLNHE